MPLASPPGRPDVVYGFGRIDASGRVADRATIAALGWRGGDRLTLTAEAGVMIARRDPEHLIAALRCLYKHAVADGILTESENPAARVPKPRRLRSTRTALPDGRLEEILHTAATTGDDRALDALLLRLHTETACRRGGALALMPEDLDAGHCLIRLHEKGETVRWQPVSPTLMSHLLAHGESRGGLAPGRPLLRYANGKPISSRRYDYLWQRLGRHLPWVATQQVSTHWIRHSTLTWVERNFGFATAQAYAGHEDHGRGGKAMATYVRAGLPEVATALAALTGEDHPLAISAPAHAVPVSRGLPDPPERRVTHAED